MANYQSRHTGQEIDKSTDQAGIFYITELNSVAAVTTGTTQRTRWIGTCYAGTTPLINAEKDLATGLTVAFKIPAGKLADFKNGTTLKIGAANEHPVVVGNNAFPSTQYVANSVIILTYDADPTVNVIINGNSSNALGKGVWRITSFLSDAATLNGFAASYAGNRATNVIVSASATGTIQTEKLAISSGSTTKAHMEYNTTEDCIDFIFD